MKRRELETALRTAGRVARETEFFLIGSQAVHAYCRRPPAEVLLSQECDLYPMNRPEIANLLDAQLGRGSRFARRRGFYVDVVTPPYLSEELHRCIPHAMSFQQPWKVETTNASVTSSPSSTLAFFRCRISLGDTIDRSTWL